MSMHKMGVSGIFIPMMERHSNIRKLSMKMLFSKGLFQFNLNKREFIVVGIDHVMFDTKRAGIRLSQFEFGDVCMTNEMSYESAGDLILRIHEARDLVRNPEKIPSQ